MNEIGNNVISYLLEQIDNSGANIVAQTYQNLVNHYSAVIYILLTVYVGFVFIKMMRGYYDANDFIVLLIRSVIILTLAMNYEYFCLFIYNLLTNEPLTIAKSFAIQGGSAEPMSVAHGLDNFLNTGRDASAHIFSMGSWSNPTYLLFGFFIFTLVMATAALAAGLIVLAKCAAIVLLALSPLFIFCALYDATKGLFDAYLRQLIAYALIPIVTCVLLMILLSVSDVATKELMNSQSPNLMQLIPFGIMCMIQIYLLLQIKSQCTALASGIHFPSVMSALRQLRGEMS